VLSAALSIQRKLLAEDNPDLLYTLDSLGAALEGQGKWAEAEAVHREALTVSRKLGGPDGPEALVDLERLVRVLMAEKKFGEAEPLMAQAPQAAFPTEISTLTVVERRWGKDPIAAARFSGVVSRI
jgi:hypothetical protein